MSEIGNNTSHANSKHGFSVQRVLLTLVPLCLIIVGGYFYYKNKIETEPKAGDERAMLANLRLNKKPKLYHLSSAFTDTNNDLVADAPTDPAKFVNPDTLVFSYVGAEDSERQETVWKQFTAALAKATDKKVEFLVLKTTTDQLAAFKNGKLHVTAFSTGTVPEAVREYGFVPDFTLAAADGKIGHTMQLIVPAASRIKDIPDLKDKRLALVDMKSNSGYKAPLVILMNDYDLWPERDFQFFFTHGHDDSIREIAANKCDAAPVASDMLARAIDRGEIKPEQYRVIYESGRFPSTALGHAYNLHPDLVKAINQTFKDFEWSGTGLEQEYGPAGIAKFVPADYREQWTLIRRIDEAMGPDPVVPADPDETPDDPTKE